MASVNKVQIIGNLGRDPETRTFPSGDMVANVRIATTDRWKDRETGENKEATEWHSVVFNGRLAEIVSQYLRKGSQVYVEGSLRTRKWSDQSGQERYTTEIRADSMQMHGSRQDGGGQRDQGGYDDRGGQQRGGGQQRQQPQQPQQRQAPQGRERGNGGYQQQPQRQQEYQGGGSGFDDMDSDIPFVTSSFSFDAESKLDRRIRRANRTRHES